MSEVTLQGQGSSQGIAIGQVYPLQTTFLTPHYWITHKEVHTELKRFSIALSQAKSQWRETLARLSRFYAKDQNLILESHLLLLEDETFKRMVELTIKKNQINVEWALEQTGHHLKIAFADGQESFAHKRIEDIDAVISKVLDSLGFKNPLLGLAKVKEKNLILVTESLSPASVANLPRERICGFVTSGGGLTSHSLILARSLRMPALSGIEKGSAKLLAGQKVILDGFEGKLLVNPNKSELKKYKDLALKHQLLEKLLLEDAQEPALTKDGKRIFLEANVELPEEIPSVLKYGAEGIGLFRTEFLFWNPLKPPSEESQVKLYRQLIKEMQGRPVTLRTLDVSGEEWLQTEVNNPALGLRGIRFGLKETLLLKTQLRAILKASTDGPVKILLPMVSRLEEIEEFHDLLKEVRSSLQPMGIVKGSAKTLPLTKARVGFTPRGRIELGVMIEVPAAYIIMEQLAKHVDFFAIGTNDLMQYILALDRTNEHVASLCSPFHPAVLKVLNEIVSKAKKAKKPVLLCGELGGDPLFLPVLIGLGLVHFSMNPQSIPKAKKIIRSLSAKKCAQWFKKLLRVSHSREMEKKIKALASFFDL